MHILLVEDEPASARLIREYLSGTAGPSDVRVASSLQAALATLGDNPPDAVLLDLGLPDSQGMETLEAMRAASARVPIVVLTGLDDPDAALGALRQGADDYLVKGRFGGEELARALRYAVERRRYLVQENELLAMLQRVGETVARELDVDRIVAVVAEEARAATAASLAAVAYAGEPSTREGERPRRVALASAGRTASALVSDGLEHSPLFDEELNAALRPAPKALLDELTRLSGAPVEDAIVVPIGGRRAHVQAALFLAHPDGDRLRRRDERIAIGIGAWANLALHNARLFSERKQAIATRDRLLAVVSHDLRSPLGVVSTAAELLARSDESAVRARFVDQVRRAVQQMDRLVSDLLDLAAIDAGSLKLDRSKLDVAGIVREAAQTARTAASGGRTNIELRFAENLPRAEIDGVRILQVLSNLIGNALEVTPEDGAARVSVECDGDELRIAIADEGPCITEDTRILLFERDHKGKKRGGRAAGLRLAIARELVRAHGGDIEVDSGRERGATFVVRLPAGSPS